MRPLGDLAGLIDVADFRQAQEVARRFSATDVIPAATTVGIVGPTTVDGDGGEHGEHGGGEESVEGRSSARAAISRSHEIPVVFDGPDIAASGLSRQALEAARWELEVGWLGFMPGFAYLIGLPPEVSALGRLDVARPRVAPGSFACAGGLGGIYPSASPGGWQLLGRSATPLFDADAPPYALLQPGDSVRLVPVADLPAMGVAEREVLDGEDLVVLEAGLSLIEDLGRRGCARFGVPRAGAANEFALRAANLAVGNAESQAAIEVLGDVRFRAGRELLMLVSGTEVSLSVDGTGHAADMVVLAGPGQIIRIRAPRRSVLAIGGGIDCPERFGSRSADAVSGMSPGPLRPGDGLRVGATPARARLRVRGPAIEPGAPMRLRAIAGPDELASGVLDALTNASWRVDLASDRTGVRLTRRASGDAGGRDDAFGLEGAEVASHAMVPGAIQVPPGGSPVILGPDCGPVGGYAVAATVITADLWRVGALSPGDAVEISLVSIAYAVTARRRLEAAVAASVTGWFPTRVG